MIPRAAQKFLDAIPPEFVDDGCSSWFDSWLGTNYRWACRLHDFGGCSRCWPPGTLTAQHKRRTNRALRRWVNRSGAGLFNRMGTVMFWGVTLFWRSYDSCGPEAGEVCRHGMKPPDWMEV